MHLHYETVNPKMVQILGELMATSSLKDFYLVGGTALSLQWGHRISEDIDMFRFSNEEVDGTLIYDELEQKFSKISELSRQNYYLKLLIDDVKIDLLRYRYPLIDSVIVIDGIRMLSPKDIAPMKLLAINNRGAKKDFYDLYFLLKQFSINEMFGFYEQKYGAFDAFQLQKSLCYFDDADNRLQKLEPLSAITWDMAKTEIKRIAKCI
jgi:predicted nucleotidyltransferase component of viral defense system